MIEIIQMATAYACSACIILPPAYGYRSAEWPGFPPHQAGEFCFNVPLEAKQSNGVNQEFKDGHWVFTVGKDVHDCRDKKPAPCPIDLDKQCTPVS